MRNYQITHKNIVLDELAAYPYCKVMPKQDKIIIHGCMAENEIENTPYAFKLNEGSLRLPSSFLSAYAIPEDGVIKGETQYYSYEYKSNTMSRRKVVLYATCPDIPILPPIKAMSKSFSVSDYRIAKEIPVKRCFNEMYLDAPLISDSEYITVTVRMGETFRIEVKNATMTDIKIYPNISELRSEYGYRLQSFCGKELTWIESSTDRIHIPKKFFIDAEIKNEDKFAVFAHKSNKKKFFISPVADGCVAVGKKTKHSPHKPEKIAVCEERDDSAELKAVLGEVSAMKEMLKLMVEKQAAMKDEYESKLERQTRKNEELVEKLKAIVESL